MLLEHHLVFAFIRFFLIVSNLGVFFKNLDDSSVITKEQTVARNRWKIRLQRSLMIFKNCKFRENGTPVPVKRDTHSDFNGTLFRNGLLTSLDQVPDDLSSPQSGVSEGLTGHLEPDIHHEEAVLFNPE